MKKKVLKFTVLLFVIAMCVMQVLAASYGYIINDSTPVYVCKIDNTNPSEASVAYLNTRPNTANTTVTIHVKASNNQWADDLYSRSFPSAVSVSDLSFSVPAGTKYYVFVTANGQLPAEGSVSLTHIIP